MFDYLRGILVELTPTYAVIECAGVGYIVTISLQTYTMLEGREEAMVYVHHIVREDAEMLYGFAERSERDIFRLLIGVSGVGGGTARVILSTYTPSELANNHQQNAQKVANELGEKEMVINNQIVNNVYEYVAKLNADLRYDIVLSSTTTGGPIINANPALDITAEIVEGLNAAYKK